METTSRSRLSGRALIACLLLAGGIMGQTRTAVRFDRFELNNPRSPDFRERSHSQAKAGSEWLQIYTQYAAEGGARDGWLDELELRWSVLIRTSEGLYVLLKTRAVYVDVEADGSRRNAVVYVRPSLIRRYCGRRPSRIDAWVYVEAVVDGQVVGRQEHGRNPPAANWWMGGDQRQVKVLNGALLTRDQTPFAPLDHDFYESLKIPSVR